MQARFCLGILPQQQPRPRQRIGHRLKPGKKQRQNLVADLLRIQLEAIASAWSSRAATSMESRSPWRSRFASARRARIMPSTTSSRRFFAARNRPHLRQRRIQQKLRPRQRDQKIVEIHDDVHLVVDLMNLRRHFGIEKSACRDLQGQPHHFGGNIQFCSGLPFARKACGKFHDLRGVALDTAPVKGRCGNASSPVVRFLRPR